jgi:hypothetical protein
MSSKKSLLKSKPPRTVQFIIYSAAAIVIVLGLITLTSVDVLIDNMQLSSVQELSR